MQQQGRRNRFIIGVLALGLLAGAALTAPPAQAQVAGPYYAEPAWDRNMTSVNRFVVLTDWSSEAVLDKETGLVWEKSPDAGLIPSWVQARSACTSKTTGGHKGWRLPSMPELASLIHPSGFTAGGPTLPPGHPFATVLPNFYWSATTDAVNSTFAWQVSFGVVSGVPGSVTSFDKATLVDAWCVRGGNNEDMY